MSLVTFKAAKNSKYNSKMNADGTAMVKTEALGLLLLADTSFGDGGSLRNGLAPFVQEGLLER